MQQKGRKKLEAFDAGKLEVLKQCILENKDGNRAGDVNIKMVSISSTVIILYTLWQSKFNYKDRFESASSLAPA